MVGVFVSVLQFVAIVNAFIRSWRERFLAGTIGAIARALLVVAGAIGFVWSRATRFPGSANPGPTAASVMVLAAAVLGPIVSFTALWLAHRRRKDVPAAEEERLSPPFNAWLPVALFDAAFVAIQGLALLVAARSD